MAAIASTEKAYSSGSIKRIQGWEVVEVHDCECSRCRMVALDGWRTNLEASLRDPVTGRYEHISHGRRASLGQ